MAGRAPSDLLAVDRSDRLVKQRVMRVVIAMLVVAMAVAVYMIIDPKPRLAATNSVSINMMAVEDVGSQTGEVCATNQYIPAGVGAVQMYGRVHGDSDVELAVALKTAGEVPLSKGSALVKEGHESFTIPVGETTKRVHDGQTCISVVGPGRVSLAGSPGTDADSGLVISGHESAHDIHLSYMTAAPKSLLEMAPTIFARAALFRPGWVGSWWFYLLTIAVLVVVGGAAWAVINATCSPSRFGTKGWLMIAMMFAGFNAFAWSTVSPIFMPPDETGHYAYVETLGQSHTLPARSPETSKFGSYGKHQELVVQFIAVNIVLNPEAKQPWDRAKYESWKKLDKELPDLGKDQGGGWTSASNYSPLYYAPAVALWRLGGKDDVLTRAWLVRLWSVLLTIFTTALVFLFARELLPAVVWAGPVAGLAAAFHPMFVHIGGAVNNDSLLILTSTVVLLLCARMINRGLTLRRALALSAGFSLAILVKPTALALALPAGFAVGFTLWRDLASKRIGGGDAAIALGSAAALAGLILSAYYLPLGSGDSAASSAAIASSEGMSLGGFAQYLRDWYLPALDGFRPLAQGLPVIGIFVRGFFADFNSLDTHFHNVVYLVISLTLGALVGGACAWGWRSRDQLRKWWPQAALCLFATIGMLGLINARSYAHFASTGEPFAQGRYILPIVGVFAALVVAGAMGFKKWAPAVAASVVIGLVLLNTFGMALSMARFYT